MDTKRIKNFLKISIIALIIVGTKQYGGQLMETIKKKLKYIPLIVIALFVIFLLLPFFVTIKIYNPFAGVYFKVHGTYAVAVDYTKENTIIPNRCMFRPVTETGTLGIIDGKGSHVLESVHIPNTVQKIGDASFFGFDSLKEVTGGENVTIIEDGAFQGDDLLRKIPYFGSLEIIERHAFAECNLINLDLPNSVKEIGDEAFRWNSIKEFNADLTNVKLGYGVFRGNPFEKEMGEFAIYPDGSLQAYNGNKDIIIIPDGVKSISGAFYRYGKELEDVEVYIPSTVETITAFSFIFYNRGTIYIPDSVKTIGHFEDGTQPTFSNASIVTTKGSYAEEFAKEYNIDYTIVDEITIMSRTKVHVCEVISIDKDMINLEEDGVIYKITVKNNEWVSEGDTLLMECHDDNLKEESTNIYTVTEGLLSKLENSVKGN